MLEISRPNSTKAFTIVRPQATKVIKQTLYIYIVHLICQLNGKAFCEHSYKHYLKEQLKESHPCKFSIKLRIYILKYFNIIFHIFAMT